VRRVGSITAPSIEHNFVRLARRWNDGVPYHPSQKANWGLGDQRLETRMLNRAAWDDGKLAA
jgi:hypothetical protein